MNILEWPSLSDYLDDSVPAVIARLEAQATALNAVGSTSHYAHSRLVDAKGVAEKARYGDMDLLRKASDILAELEIQHATADRPRWDHHVAGGSLSIGRFTMGHPLCMNRRIPVTADFRQIKIVVNTGLSCGVSGHAAALRAAMIIGLLNKLTAEGVDLDLYLYEDGEAPTEGLASRATGKPWAKRLRHSDNSRDYCQMVKLDTRPVNLAQACYVLTQAEVFGSLMLPAAIDSFVGSEAMRFPKSQYFLGKPEWIKRSRVMLGMGPNDLYIASFDLSEVGMSPQKWIDTYARQALEGVAVAA